MTYHFTDVHCLGRVHEGIYLGVNAQMGVADYSVAPNIYFGPHLIPCTIASYDKSGAVVAGFVSGFEIKKLKLEDQAIQQESSTTAPEPQPLDSQQNQD